MARALELVSSQASLSHRRNGLHSALPGRRQPRPGRPSHGRVTPSVVSWNRRSCRPPGGRTPRGWRLDRAPPTRHRGPPQQRPAGQAPSRCPRRPLTGHRGPPRAGLHPSHASPQRPPGGSRPWPWCPVCVPRASEEVVGPPDRKCTERGSESARGNWACSRSGVRVEEPFSRGVGASWAQP